MWYGFVSNNMTLWTQDFTKVNTLAKICPYPKFRGFQTEEEAILFIKKNKRNKLLKSLKTYGNVFTNVKTQLEYYIEKDRICANLRTKGMYNIRIPTTDKNVLIEYGAKLVKIQLKDIYLNDNLISSHITAIYNLLKLLGDFIDIDIVVPDNSIYYALTTYTGSNILINRVQLLIKKRFGELAITVREW